MKILVIGDFHGKVPTILPKIIKKEKPDLIVSQGDFCAFFEKKLFFKYSFVDQIPLENFIGKKKAKRYYQKDIARGIKIIKYIKKFNIPIIAVSGNHDPAKYSDISTHSRDKTWDKFYLTDFLKKEENKHFKIIDFNATKFQNLVFIGTHKSSYPGYLPNKKSWQKNRPIYLRYRKKVEKLFKKYKNQKIILVSHNVPYKVLDQVKDKKAHKLAYKSHKGSFLTRETIKKYQPLICISGHIHESHGIQKLGKTIVINSGAAYEKRYVVIEINRKIKVKLRKAK